MKEENEKLNGISQKGTTSSSNKREVIFFRGNESEIGRSSNKGENGIIPAAHLSWKNGPFLNTRLL